MESSIINWKLISAEPDMIFKITSYLSYVDIDNLSNCCKEMKKIFSNIGFWERKILLDFPKFCLPNVYEIPVEDIYWHLKHLDHYCNRECYNICYNCYNRTHCFNITHCCVSHC